MEIRVWFATGPFNFLTNSGHGMISAEKGTRIITMDKKVYVQLDHNAEEEYHYAGATIDTKFIEVNSPRFFKEI